MIAKWYFGALLALITAFGLTSENNFLPNQEIVLSFNRQNVTIEQAEDALTAVRERLQKIGVEELQIDELNDGSLRISYYSEEEVSFIAELFSDDLYATIDNISYNQEEIPLELPTNNDFHGYQLNVFEIQSQTDVHLDLNGCPREIATAKDYYFFPKSYSGVIPLNEPSLHQSNRKSHKIHGQDLRVKRDFLRNIREARAGPVFMG